MPRITPWIILLCKFSDDPGTSDLRSIADYAAFFGGDDRDSIPSYWRDISHGELDLMTGTEISPWLQLEQKRSDHTGLSTRNDLVNWAKAAGAKVGVDFGRFFGVAAFFAVQTDLFGGADDPHVVCDLLSSPAQILQEFGHAYGLKHSRSVVNPIDYTNPFCIMSSMTFGGDDEVFRRVDPTFASRWGASGPGLSSPYVLESGWLPESRSVNVVSNGKYPSSTTIDLSPLGDLNPPHPQMAVVQFDTPQSVRYCIEYRRGGWDRGVFYDPIVLHQLRADGLSYYSGLIRPFKPGAGGDATHPAPAISAGKWYVDQNYDLSVELLAMSADRETVTLRIAPAAAARTLSVRGIVASRLQLTGGFSIGKQVLPRKEESLRGRLIDLLGS
jgi:hypothetical protein